MTTTLDSPTTPRSQPSLEVPSGKPLVARLTAAVTSRVGVVMVAGLAILWTIPTFGLLITSFRPEEQVKTTGWWSFFSDPQVTLQNYRDVFSSSASGGFGRYLGNSIQIVIPGTIIPVVIAALAAYAFSWMRFKGRDTLFLLVVALMVVPLQLSLIPLLQLFTTIGLSGFAPIWVAHTIFGLPLAIFLLRNFIAALPREVIEAARVDGAGHLTIFLRIVLPLSVPALASLVIFQFLWVWNDLLIATVFGGGETQPMTFRLVDLAGSRGNEWQRLTAGAFVIMFLPMAVFFSLQKYFVRGLLAGSVKG